MLYYPRIKPGKAWSLLLFGLLTGFVIMIRSAGVVLVAAIAADQFLQWYRLRRKYKSEGQHYSTPATAIVFQVSVVVLPILFYFIFNSLIFKIPSGGSLRDYLVFYYSGNFLETIPPNLEKYVEVFRFMHIPAVGTFRFLALLSGSVFLSMTVFGFIRKMLTRIEVFDIFFIIYLFILLVFPNNYSAFRLLIPAWFILLYYAAMGFKSLRIDYVKSGRSRVWILGAILLLMYIPGLIALASARHSIQDGPQEPKTMVAFQYISRNVADTSTIAFFKPRALSLYTGKHGFADPFTSDPTDIHIQLQKHGVDYILVNDVYTGRAMKRYVRILKSRALEIWKSKEYHLYRILPPNPEEQY
jgi:hypothetical protein